MEKEKRKKQVAKSRNVKIRKEESKKQTAKR